ncbi:hypothetical protein BGW80DRAFT_1304300 [Lactifluus volemus]|nr:hypothetical protein BGW80DRAFT_1304300 [Lactifluus volemus]
MRNDTASIAIFTSSVLMKISSMAPLRSDINNLLTIKISCKGVDWQVSSVAQICNQLSESFISGIERLFIRDSESTSGTTLQDVIDETLWLELFHPFIAVRTLYILSQRMESYVVSALRRRSTEVLPALDELCLKEYQASGPAPGSPFGIARQGSAHTVAIHRL